MKVCIITSNYPINYKTDGTVGSFVRDFALEIHEAGHEVFVLTQAKAGERLDDEGLSIVRFPWSGQSKARLLSNYKMSSPADALAVLSVLYNGRKALLALDRTRHFDLVIALWALPCGAWAYSLKRVRGTPYVVWTLGSDIWSYERNPLSRRLLNIILKNAEHIYSDGIELARRTGEIAGRHCDFLASTRKLALNNPSGVPGQFPADKINFLFIGRYHPNKGPDILLQAVNLLPAEIKARTVFHFYGGGELEGKLHQMQRELNLANCRINGYASADECAQLMKAAHFFVLPSRNDSIPVVFSDAMQCGLPVVAARVGDLEHLVETYRIGVSFEKENASDLALRLAWACEADKKAFEPAIARAREIFDIRSSALKVLKNHSN